MTVNGKHSITQDQLPKHLQYTNFLDTILNERLQQELYNEENENSTNDKQDSEKEWDVKLIY